MSAPVRERPRLTEHDAVRLARDIYGLAAVARPLASERDQNFQLSTERGIFVLKIAGPLERPGALDMQDRALAFLAERAPGLPLPRPVPAASGARVIESDGRLVRLLTHLPGTVLAEARPQTTGLLRATGRLLGELDRALAGFSHPAARGRDLAWNPDRARAVIAEHAAAIGDPDRRALVDHFVAQHEEIVVPLTASLRRSVIHNDANDYNILVGGPTPENRAIAGLLDFGDMLEAWIACEPAVAIAYGIFGKSDPLEAACAIAAGYHEAHPLAAADLEALWTLAAIRLCTSVCLSARRRTTEPDNDYLLVSETPAWEALRRMRGVHPRLAAYRLRAACGLTPCPQTPAIEAWLSAHGEQLGPVVPGDLSRAVVFDLSVGSPAFASPDAATDTPALTAKLFGAMRGKGATIGIGRYDEARLLYTSEAFAGTGGEHPERRTVHLAIDIFAEPETPVLAPLDGRVHGVCDNAARLDYGPTVILEHAPAGGPIFYTLYGHLSRESIRGLTAGDRVARGGRIGAIGPAPENGDWPPHVHFQIVADMLDESCDFPGVAAASARAAWLSLCPDPNLILRGPARFRAAADDAARIGAERRRLLGPSLSVAYRTPLEIVRGSGAFLFAEMLGVAPG